MNKLKRIGKTLIKNNEVVIKSENLNLELYDYLRSRDFLSFPKLVDHDEERGKNVYEYIKDVSLNKFQQGDDLASTLASLHNKTSFTKEVNLDKYKSIYDNLIGYLNYIEDYYYQILRTSEYELYPSPHETLFQFNYTKLREAITFCKKECDNWYKSVENKTKERVCLNHGNVRLSHIIRGDKSYLISWDNNHFDTPVADLIDFYHNEWENLEFSGILETYFSKAKLNDEEKKLFFISISTPIKIEFCDNEYENTERVRKLYDYLFKTEELIGPYYTVKNKEE